MCAHVHVSLKILSVACVNWIKMCGGLVVLYSRNTIMYGYFANIYRPLEIKEKWGFFVA